MTNRTDRQAWDALVTWLRGIITGATVIKSHQSADRPAKPYVMVNYLSRSRVQPHPMNVEFTDTGIDNSEGENMISAAPVMSVEWHFSIHAYGDDPTDLLRPIRSAIELPQKQESLRPLMIHDVSPRDNRVPDFINKKWEERAQMDIYVRGYTRDGFIIDVIDTFEGGQPTDITSISAGPFTTGS